MYGINLIRHTVIPERHKRVIFSVISFSALAYALTALAVIFFSAANFRMIDAYAREIDRLEAELSVLYPGTPTEGELDVIVRRMRPDLDEIGKLVDRKVETTYIWEAIASAVPDSVWLTSVHLKVPEQETGGSKGRSRKLAGGIVAEGFAIPSGGTASGSIRRFAERLKSSDELKGYIADAKYSETGMKTISGKDVIGFEVTCPFK
jgi:hypothetical protein